MKTTDAVMRKLVKSFHDRADELLNEGPRSNPKPGLSNEERARYILRGAIMRDIAIALENTLEP